MERSPSPEAQAEYTLAEHSFRTWGIDARTIVCTCGERFEDTYFFTGHQVDKLKDAGLMIGFSTGAEPTEREEMAQVIGEDSIQAILDQYTAPPMDPDCVQGKHKACGGTAWDTVNDEPIPCSCVCHKEEK